MTRNRPDSSDVYLLCLAGLLLIGLFFPPGSKAATTGLEFLFRDTVEPGDIYRVDPETGEETVVSIDALYEDTEYRFSLEAPEVNHRFYFHHGMGDNLILGTLSYEDVSQELLISPKKPDYPLTYSDSRLVPPDQVQYRYYFYNEAYGRMSIFKTAISGYEFDGLTNLPGTRHHSATPDNFISESPDEYVFKVTRNPSSQDCRLYTVSVTDASYHMHPNYGELPTWWEVEAMDINWDMDAGGLGFNPDEECNEESGSPSRKFTYLTPSDPREYTAQATINATIKFEAYWCWFEGGIKMYRPDSDGWVVCQDETPEGIPDGFEHRFSNDPGHVVGSAPMYLHITGTVEKEINCALALNIKDKTPPYTAVIEPDILHATTGDFIFEWNDAYGESSGQNNPEEIVVRFVDNNPWIEVSPGEIESTGGLFDPGDLEIQFYYAIQLNDYTGRKGERCGKPGFQHPYTCDCIASYGETFTFVRKRLGPSTEGVSYAVQGYTQDAVPTDTDPAYSVVECRFPVEMLDEAMGPHFATTSKHYRDTWGARHSGWDKGRRLKYFPVVNDGSGNINPPFFRTSFETVDGLEIFWNGPAFIEENETADGEVTALRSALAALDISGPSYVRDGKWKICANEDVTDDPDWINQCGQTPSWPPEPEIVSLPDWFPQQVDYFGTYGFITVYDNDRPNVTMSVTDTRLNKTFMFGNVFYGDFKRAAYRTARERLGKVKTTSNRDRLDEPVRIYFKPRKYTEFEPSELVPFSEADNQEATWQFKANLVSGNIMQSDMRQGKLVERGEFCPWLFRIIPEFATHVVPMKPGLCIQEDVRLIFSVRARDNINTFQTGEKAGGIVTSSDPVSNLYNTFYIYENGKEFRGEGIYHFRVPFEGPGGGSAFAQVTVEDDAPPITGGTHSRCLTVHLFVLPSTMKVFTLQEDETY